MAVASEPRIRARSARRLVEPPLAILLAIGALLGIAWSLILPPLQGPDESAHIAAVTWLVEDGSFGTAPGLPRELLVLARDGGLGPLVGNVAARPAWSAEAQQRVRRELEALGSRRAEFVDSATGPPRQGAARNSPLYSVYQAIPYTLARGAPLLDRLTLMRLWNVPLLLVTIAACWRLAAEIFPGVALAPLLAGGLAALQPELVFITGVITPDILLIALTTLFCLIAARMLKRGVSVRSASGLLVLALAAVATNPRGVALLPCTAAAIALAIRWRSLAVGERWRTGVVIFGGLAVSIVAVAVAAASAGVNLAGTSLDTGRGFSAREFAAYVWQFYLPPLPFMSSSIGGDYGIKQAGIDTAWGAFASLDVQFPGWVYDLITAVLGLVAVAAIAAAIRGRTTAAGIRVAVLLATVVVATFAVLHVGAYRSLLVDPSDPIIVGRQLLVLVGPLAILLAFALTAYGRRVAAPLTALAFGGLISLDVAALWSTAIRFYA